MSIKDIPWKDIFAWLGLTGIVGTIGSVIALQFFPYVEFTLKPVEISFDNYRSETWHVYFREIADESALPSGLYPERIRPGTGALDLQFFDHLGYVRGKLKYPLGDGSQTWGIRGYVADEFLSLAYFNIETRTGIGSYEMKKIPSRSGEDIIYSGWTISRESNYPGKFVACPAIFSKRVVKDNKKKDEFPALELACDIREY